MYIFGGILELTKELNELICFDFDTKCFACMEVGFQPEDEEWNEHGSGGRAQEDMSPGLRSPDKTGKRMNLGMSPTKSPSKTMSMKAKSSKSPSKVTKDQQAAKNESSLASPTSISMQNSFIIKNADESFDAYYAQMRKRKMGGGNQLHLENMHGGNTGGYSATLQNSPGPKESNFGVVAGIQPAARDGHSCEISDNGLMFVFGGDRHHMPFNDLYLIKL